MVENKISDTFQMNDYAITKWAGELMCLNATTSMEMKLLELDL